MSLSELNSHLKKGTPSEAEKNLAQTNVVTHDFGKTVVDEETLKIAMAEARKYIDVDPSSIKVEDLPKEWNWKSVKGVDFTRKVIS